MLNATVAKKEICTPGLFIIRVVPDVPLKGFQAGQYLTLGLPGSSPRPEGGPVDIEPVEHDKILRRAYSIASSPDDTEGVEFFIAVVPEGLLTPRLSLLKEGDRVYITPKCVGKFTLESCKDASSLIFLSTGTGVAPFISMLRWQGIWDITKSVTLFHGVRLREDLSYDSELRLLQEKMNGRFRYIPVVSREEAPEGGYRGYVQRVLNDVGIPVRPESDHIYACGNPAMVTEVEESLLAKGFLLHEGKKVGNLHLEKYW